MLETYQRQAKQRLIATITSIVVIAGFVLYVDHLQTLNAAKVSSTAQTSTQAAPTPPPSSTNPVSSSSTATPPTSNSSSGSSSSSTSAKDGTFTAASTYYVPHSEEEIKVSLTLKNGIITDSSVENSEGDRTSAMFQEDFAASYKSYVVGKNISGLQIGIVSGASDTTQAFNDALGRIASQVQG